MVRKPTPRQKNNGRLEEAIALLLNNKAQFLAQLAKADERAPGRTNGLHVSTNASVVSSKNWPNIKAILLRHEQMFQALPEAIRQKIGFDSR